MWIDKNSPERTLGAFDNAHIGTWTGMSTNNQEMAEYLSLIKKFTKIKIKDPSHKQFREDVVQDVFLKLHKNDFFNTNNLNASDDDDRQISAYIMRTVSSCYMDHLKSLGINRRLTKSESAESGHRYETINTQTIENTDDGVFISPSSESPDHYVFIEQALHWIEDCFNSVFSGTKDTAKRDFFNAAFWEFDKYGMTMKEMAQHLGYTSSNPTQELKRFSEKVSLCTAPHGIVLTSPNEQIQFLREQMDNAEAHS
jgi:DNA-directed RNA polymerase specialized sigma24 family protein|tara:strand:- start:9531 stop:10295 length:765 start_codon:yes stop_codon:yes gene_type:complete